MKKLIIWVSSNENKQEYIEKYCPKPLIFKNNKFWIQSSITKKEQIEIEIMQLELIDFDNELILTLDRLYRDSVPVARKLSKEPVGEIIDENYITDVFFSIVLRYGFEDEQNDIFTFCRDLFVRALMKHTLTNGNKRTAIVFLKYILKNFGYYLMWTEDLLENYYQHTEMVEYFVKNLDSTNAEEAKNKIKAEILDWIKGNVKIDLLLHAKQGGLNE